VKSDKQIFVFVVYFKYRFERPESLGFRFIKEIKKDVHAAFKEEKATPYTGGSSTGDPLT